MYVYACAHAFVCVCYKFRSPLEKLANETLCHIKFYAIFPVNFHANINACALEIHDATTFMQTFSV